MKMQRHGNAEGHRRDEFCFLFCTLQTLRRKINKLEPSRVFTFIIDYLN